MHPFSLDKSQQQRVQGGISLLELLKDTKPQGCLEGGGIIPPDFYKTLKK